MQDSNLLCTCASHKRILFYADLVGRTGHWYHPTDKVFMPTLSYILLKTDAEVYKDTYIPTLLARVRLDHQDVFLKCDSTECCRTDPRGALGVDV